jgi:hypothetical protein
MVRKFRELLPPTSEGTTASAGTAASLAKLGARNPRMFAHSAVGEVLWGMRMSIGNAMGCHPGLSEDLVGNARKFAFMAHGFVPDFSQFAALRLQEDCLGA